MHCFLFVASLTFAVILHDTIASGYVKKSDINEFASAINGAGRLRYGKRAHWDSFYPESLLELDESVDAIDKDNNYQYAKRAPMPSNLLQTLNNAERLRFGRK